MMSWAMDRVGVLGKLSRDRPGWQCLVALTVLFRLSDKEESMEPAESEVSKEVSLTSET